VYFVADTRYAGDLEGGATWPGQAVYARALPQGEVAAYLPGLAPSAGYLTVFLDRSNPRPGTADLYFAPAADLSDVVPEPVVVTVSNPVPIPLELVGLVVVVWLVIRRQRRRRAQG
jgi:hypothetical protein